MDNEQSQKKDEEVTALLDELLGDAQEEKTSEGTAEGASSPLSALAANSELMAKLPELLSVMKPLLGGAENSGQTDKKLALLCALKPYLSPKRCETIDYITKVSRLGDTLKHIKL